MNIELLVVTDCPNEAPAAALLRAALHDVGLSGVAVTTTVIDTQQSAEEHNFVGSPTILINGQDPFHEETRTPGVACRLYNTPAGPAALPDLRNLRRAIKMAAAAAAKCT